MKSQIKWLTMRKDGYTFTGIRPENEIQSTQKRENLGTKSRNERSLEKEKEESHVLARKFGRGKDNILSLHRPMIHNLR